MIVYIVRHGETDWNRVRRVQGHTDIELNDYGRKLAEETAEGMKEIHLDLCFTSPLKRAKETALIVLGDRQIPVYDEPRIEEISFGRYEGVRIGGEDEDSRAFGRFFSDTAHYEAPADGRRSVSCTNGPGTSFTNWRRGRIWKIKAFLYPPTARR